MTTPTPEQIMKAHQCLYYNGDAVWTDYEYDQFCKKHGLDGIGGGGRYSDYPAEIVAIAEQLKANPACCNKYDTIRPTEDDSVRDRPLPRGAACS